ncbi:sensor histidine kinase [Neobacillus jeddahensis]|uniref:sensor histidine kinase n=1 Tax=Neobacillus jeddahensis TaxID=1461580 RepID=UPI0006936D19|nr:sensor histidine kinase [Neobacillus jeddahensis]
MVWGVIQQNRRKLISVAVIFFLMWLNRLFIGPFPKMGLNILIGLTYSAILFLPRSWWTKTKVLITILILMVESAAGVYWFHELMLIYLLAIIIFSASIQLSLSKSPNPAMVAMFITAMFYRQFGNGTLFSILSFICLSIVLYFMIRIRVQRNEMIQVNQQQLVELQEAYEQLQEASSTAMEFAVMEERTRIARDIHDAVGHSLTSLIVQMQALKYMIKKDPEEAGKSLDGMLVVARQGLQDIRTSVHSLADHQAGSGMTPLKALLTRMEASAAIQYEFHADVMNEELDKTINGLLFRVLQEAITNVIRHSQATKVGVRLQKESGKIVMRIRDNGRLDTKQVVREGFGLKVMKARIEEHGGQLNYAILDPNGFEITAEIPIDYNNQNLELNEG